MNPATQVAVPNGAAPAAIEDVDRAVVMGDLSGLSAPARVEFYMRTCRSLGLNPLTKPFAYIKLNGQLTLYARRDCADQLRRLRGISIQIVDKKITEGLLSVHVRATDKDGRSDEDFGVVPINGTLVGEAGANLIMKAVTKAKRRVTLSICGLGMLDESEVHTVPDVEFVELDDAGEPRVVAPVKTKPKSKRKSSSQAKKDGDYEQLFKPIDEALDKANEVGAEACKEVWKRYENVLAWFPVDWHDLLAQKFMDAMEANDETVQIELLGKKL